MAESDESLARADANDQAEGIAVFGSVLMVVGGVLCGGALLLAEGRPPWQVLVVFMFIVVAGLVLRIEGAVRRRSP